MSGVRIIRLVTPEDKIDFCNLNLLRLDREIEHWTKQGQQIDALSEEEVAATLARRRTLDALISPKSFWELQRQVNDEITFLQSDLLRREKAAIEKTTMVHKRQRQGRENAITLMNALESKGIPVHAGLKTQLQAVARGDTVKSVDSILAEGFTLLVPNTPNETSNAQRELANRLKESSQEQSFEEWKAQHVAISPAGGLFERVDGLVAEAQTILRDEQVSAFALRLRNIEAEQIDARQTLLLDSLALDLLASMDDERKRRAATRELAELAIDIKTLETAAALPIREQIAACDATTPLETLQALANQCRTLLADELQRKGAQSRRNAILQGLARLGYDVHEGMATAWAQEGNIVVRNPSLPGYGVEVGGNAENSRLQVRAVSLNENRDTARDKDVEVLWCDEFDRLQALIAEDGNELIIEREVAAGQAPLKVVLQEESREASIVRSARAPN